MKTGIILYIIGDHPPMIMDYVRHKLKKWRPQIDRIALVSQDEGHWDVSDAWWDLTVKGMHRIGCKMAQFAENGELNLLDSEIWLTNG